MPYICSSCGKFHHSDKTYPNMLCQGCYNYFRRGGIVNPLPHSGTIALDSRGFIICHICGKAYTRLGSHIKESHGMTISEYKRKFGLCENCKTTESKYSKTMHDYAYKNGMPERLKRAGYNTRIKVGERDKRLGKITRLQESLDKKARMEARCAKCKMIRSTTE